MTTTTTTAQEIAKFEVGETYYDRSSCDWDTIFRFKITRRTEKSIWFVDPREPEAAPKRRSIRVFGDAETFSPFGHYSMAAVASADRKASELEREAA